MTECQGCGAWNDASRALCVLCGTPLAETDEWDAGANPPPLPPLPDGGLAAAMPDWLRAAPTSLSAPAPSSAAVSATPPRRPLAPIAPTLGPRADPRTFLTDDDFPRWIHDLAARQPPRRPLAAPAPPASPDSRDAPLPWPVWPATAIAPTAPAPEPSAPPLETLKPPPAPPPPNRREQPLWERVLLVLVFLGVIIAALWALIANGVIG